MYERCLDCKVPNKSVEDKKLCSLHWRPCTGTKAGFPRNGWSCPRDTWDALSENEKEKIREVILDNRQV